MSIFKSQLINQHEELMAQSTRLTLIQRVSNSKDEKSWKEFVEVYRNYIMGFVKKMGIHYDEVEDITQNILLKIWKQMPRFEYQPGNCRFRSWLTIVSRTVIIDYKKLKQNKMRDKIDSNEVPEQELISEIELVALNEWKEFITTLAWERISKRFNKVELDIFQKSSHKSISEIATETGLAENTVYIYRKRIEIALKKEILDLNFELG